MSFHSPIFYEQNWHTVYHNMNYAYEVCTYLWYKVQTSFGIKNRMKNSVSILLFLSRNSAERVNAAKQCKKNKNLKNAQSVRIARLYFINVCYSYKYANTQFQRSKVTKILIQQKTIFQDRDAYEKWKKVKKQVKNIPCKAIFKNAFFSLSFLVYSAKWGLQDLLRRNFPFIPFFNASIAFYEFKSCSSSCSCSCCCCCCCCDTLEIDFSRWRI